MNVATLEFFIGLMSGTSLDGVDAVLLDFSGQKPRVALAESSSFASDFRARLLALNTPGDNELHRAAQAANQLALEYARVVNTLLAKAGLTPSQVKAIGAHGQTVRHRPQPDSHTGVGYTIQLNNPALLAERTSIDVVADFRSSDVAAGGQGAPLVPAFHQAWFAQPGQSVAVLNLGGMSNLTLLPAQGGAIQGDVFYSLPRVGAGLGWGSNGSNTQLPSQLSPCPGEGAHPHSTQGAVQGFDCGPGNVLLDLWCQSQTVQAYDQAGAWAASGVVLPDLLARLLDEPYFSRQPPKSTGRDLFNPTWLNNKLHGFANCRPQDVAATLTVLTAQIAARDLLRYAAQTRQLWVCGGGALNAELMRQLALALPQVQVEPSAVQGLAPMQVEAAAFAWLARAWFKQQPGNLTAVTGARGPRVLGALYRAPAA